MNTTMQVREGQRGTVSWVAALVALAAGGCGLGISEEPAGGAQNLPSASIGPYIRPPDLFETPASEPFLVTESGANLTEPFILPRGDGGFRIWFARQATGAASPTEIWYAEFASYDQLADVAPRKVMGPDFPWEQTVTSAPSILVLEDKWLMFYSGGDALDALGVAVSTDEGATWSKRNEPVLTGVSRVSVAQVGDALWLVGERAGQSGIWRAVGTPSDVTVWTFDAEPLVTERPENEEAFDRASVSSPMIVTSTTVSGRTRVGVWYTGLSEANNGDTAAVGYIGTFVVDGQVAWERFHPTKPVLLKSGRQPGLHIMPRSGMMVFAQQQGQNSAIAIALHPNPPKPKD